MWASLGSGDEAAAGHHRELLGLWLFRVLKALKCLLLFKVGRFCEGVGSAWNAQKLLLHLSPARCALQCCFAGSGLSWTCCFGQELEGMLQGSNLIHTGAMPGADFCQRLFIFPLCPSAFLPG